MARIRTLKPEIWADEKVGHVSRDARVLFLGLITMADDEGRILGLPAVILGHVFPYDQDAPRKLARWLDELVDVGLVIRYEVDGTPYMWLRGWHHQRIEKRGRSILPPPPDGAVSCGRSGSDPGTLRDGSLPSRADARPGSPPDPDPAVGSSDARAPARNPEERPEVARLCRLLADLILANDPKAPTAPDGDRWRTACRLLLDQDQRTPAEVEQVIRWCQADDFWRSNVLSMPTLRKQYTRLLLRMQRPRPAQVTASDQAAEWLARGRQPAGAHA